MMGFFDKNLLSDEVLTKWVYLVLFLKKNQVWSKNPKISLSKFKLTLAEGGYMFFFKKKNKQKTKCLGSNKNVNVALFCVVVQRKIHLWYWKMYFTLILKFCLNSPIETKQENYKNFRFLIFFFLFKLYVVLMYIICIY